MEHRSKELLRLEHKSTSFSSLESSLLLCGKDSNSPTKKRPSDGTPFTVPVPPSQFLGKVKDFLGVISEANQQLELHAKDNPRNYDIEELTGNESEVVEMDLMLGVADLHTPEAVAAAESAVSGSQRVIPVAADSSDSDSDGSNSDDEKQDKKGSDDDGGDGSEKNGSSSCSLVKRPVCGEDEINSRQKRNQDSKKRPKIVELS